MGNPFFDFFLILAKTLQKKIYNRNMDILISNLLSETILDFGKWSNGKYANARILRLTTSRSQKLIPKADLK